MRSTSTPTAAQEAGLPSPDELAHAMQPAEFKPAANGCLELELIHGRSRSNQAISRRCSSLKRQSMRTSATLYQAESGRRAR